jgi:hypothetical protein
MNPLSHEQRIEAICRLEAASDQYPAASTLKAIDKLLVFGQGFSHTDLERIVGKRAYSLQVERGIELYLMMARIMKVCEPKGPMIGPACAVRRIDFEQLTREEALDLKNGIGFRLVTQSPSLSNRSEFSGLDLLTTEEQELYENIKPYFNGRQKPTLQILAARMLRNSHDRSFSDRSVVRYIDALESYRFVDENRRRDYLISSVNSFGAHNKSAAESARYAMAQAVAQIGPVIRQQLILVLAETARLVAQTLPRIPDILPQLGESIVAMRETLLQQTLPLLAQSVADIPVVLPQLQLATADLYRSVPQTLSLMANLNLNPRQN